MRSWSALIRAAVSRAGCLIKSEAEGLRVGSGWIISWIGKKEGVEEQKHDNTEYHFQDTPLNHRLENQKALFTLNISCSSNISNNCSKVDKYL